VPKRPLTTLALFIHQIKIPPKKTNHNNQIIKILLGHFNIKIIPNNYNTYLQRSTWCDAKKASPT
jgi:hypothetical protein